MFDDEMYKAFIEALEGIKFPHLKIDKKNMLIHGFSFDLPVVEDVVKQVTSEYAVSNCVHPRYMVCLEFNDEASFNVAAVALKMRFS